MSDAEDTFGKAHEMNDIGYGSAFEQAETYFGTAYRSSHAGKTTLVSKAFSALAEWLRNLFS